MTKKKVLHVGCGPANPETLHKTFHGDDWEELRLDINPAVEPDIVGSMTDMRVVADESVDAVWSSHNLEHLFAHEVHIALSEFCRVIKKDGFALITLPDVEAIAKEVVKGNLEGVLYQSPAGPISPIDVIWGHRSAIAAGNHYMAHKTGFNAATLREKLGAAGFHGGKIESRDFALWAVAYKEAPKSE